MSVTPKHEERWGPVGAVLYRLVIPAGLTGVIVLLLPLIWATSFYAFAIYPFLVAGIAFACVRNVLLAKGRARWLAAVLGLALTGLAAFLAFALFIGSGGV